MQQAESAKSLLSIQNNTESQSSTSAVKGKHKKFRNVVLLKFLNNKNKNNNRENLARSKV